ncbi:MAG: hypothetical protein GY765_24240 [bacterium]|nr:hypothetical protein [bacterium]
MEIENYGELIKTISKKIAGSFLAKEEDISRRALLLDADISEITRRIGLETIKIIYEESLAEHTNKKKRRDWRSKETPK